MFCVIGSVDACPLSEEPVKLPSLLFTEQERAPLASQKILVRLPEETLVGVAQISARNSPKYCGTGLAGVVDAAGFEAGGTTALGADGDCALDVVIRAPSA